MAQDAKKMGALPPGTPQERNSEMAGRFQGKGDEGRIALQLLRLRYGVSDRTSGILRLNKLYFGRFWGRFIWDASSGTLHLGRFI
jgi:hypothetical protein